MSVENNGQSRGGCTRKGFLPGFSGNPGGRPKGLASLVRSKTKNGKELVDLMLKIMRGKLTVTRYTSEGVKYEQTPSIQDRQKALEWLADRGFGKCDSVVSLQNPDGSNLIAPSILEAAAALAKTL